jgi:high-affinity nickel permease
MGLRHATDPDHLAAVSTLVAREPRAARATSLGAAWSLGHGTTLLGIGGVAVLLSAQLPLYFGALAELCVALLLVGLGVSNLRHAAHPSPHADATRSRGALMRSGFVGVAHGAAGSGLIAVAAAAAMPTPEQALLYLAAFALGTALAMIAFSTLLSAPLRWLAREPRRHRWIHRVTGSVSLVVGLALALDTARSWIA